MADTKLMRKSSIRESYSIVIIFYIIYLLLSYFAFEPSSKKRGGMDEFVYLKS